MMLAATINAEEHLPLVRRIAGRLATRSRGAIDVGDLHSAGWFGLLQAARAFDPDAGAAFETFAAFRIRGAMLDQIRKCDWASRLMRTRASQFNAALAELRQELQRVPTEGEIADRLGIDEEELIPFSRAAHSTAMVSLDAPRFASEDGDGPNEGDSLLGVLVDRRGDSEAAARRHAFAEMALELCNPRQQTLLRLYFWHGKTLAEAARPLGISESGASLMLTAILERLRSRLAGLEGELDE